MKLQRVFVRIPRRGGFLSFGSYARQSVDSTYCSPVNIKRRPPSGEGSYTCKLRSPIIRSRLMKLQRVFVRIPRRGGFQVCLLATRLPWGFGSSSDTTAETFFRRLSSAFFSYLAALVRRFSFGGFLFG